MVCSQKGKKRKCLSNDGSGQVDAIDYGNTNNDCYLGGWRIHLGNMGTAAVFIALKVQSVQELWYFTSDLVFVLLFPQLVIALFDKKANRTGSIVAFFVSLVLRAGDGDDLFGIPAFIDYPDWWPVRTIAAAAGIILLPLVSRIVKVKKQSPETAPLV